MRALLLGAAALAVLATSAKAYDVRDEDGPSFNCRYAKALDEVMICQATNFPSWTEKWRPFIRRNTT